MADVKYKKRSHGMGLIGTLVTLFVVLKLMNLIDWSWIWVFSPIWISLLIAIVVFCSILIGGRIAKGKW